MSIYSTLWIVKFPRYGDEHTGCEWVEVIGQGVPAHIGTPSPGYGYESGDPYHYFLPPAIPVPDEYDGNSLRAVVIVTENTKKAIQEYIKPLLVLSGEEYAKVSFVDLHRMICDALRGQQPRCVGEFTRADGSVCLIFGDGSTRDLPPHNST